MHRGYVKLWRKSLDAGWLSNHVLWCFWCWCLLKAAHKPTGVMVGYQKVHLEPGQLVFTFRKAASELRVNPRQLRTAVDRLKTDTAIALKPTRRYSIITIINWESYQHRNPDSDTLNDTLKAHCRHTADTPLNNKNEKNEKKEKNKSVGQPSDPPPARDPLPENQKPEKRRRQLPADFTLTNDLKTYAEGQGLNGNRVESVFAHFCDHHRAKGTVMLDWKAAWRTWVRNEKRFNQGKADKTRPPEDLLKW